jgi:hypothetical protein
MRREKRFSTRWLIRCFFPVDCQVPWTAVSIVTRRRRNTMSSAQAVTPPQTSSSVASYRVYADVAERWLALVGVILCALQVAFAAYGFWVFTASGQDAGEEAFGAHGTNGLVLGILAVVLLILGAVARSGWKGWVIPLVLAVLLFVVQGVLVGLGFSVSPWFGFLHALDGMLIAGGFVWLMVDRWRHPLRAR